MPPTPGRQVKQLRKDLDKKEGENEKLKDTISDLSKALENLQVVTEKSTTFVPLPQDKTGNDGKKNKKDVGLTKPNSAKSAYRFYSEANKHLLENSENSDMRKLWKECVGDERKKYVEMASQDKKRFEEENGIYLKKVAVKETEEKALEIYYAKQKQDLAMEFYEAHLQAQAAIINKKKKKNSKDPDAPKRSMSSFMFFSQENRESVVKKNPDKSVGEIAKILGEEWGKLNKGKGGKKGTKKYDDMAAQDKLRYEEEKASYDEMKSQRNNKMEEERDRRLQEDKAKAMIYFEEVQKQEELKIQNALLALSSPNGSNIGEVRKPVTPYSFYCLENRVYVTSFLQGNATNAEIMTQLEYEWRLLSEEEKLPYYVMAENDKIRYEDELKETTEV